MFLIPPGINNLYDSLQSNRACAELLWNPGFVRCPGMNAQVRQFPGKMTAGSDGHGQRGRRPFPCAGTRSSARKTARPQ